MMASVEGVFMSPASFPAASQPAGASMCMCGRGQKMPGCDVTPADERIADGRDMLRMHTDDY
jgi:hypothetical protein